jgi:hypothetical protein
MEQQRFAIGRASPNSVRARREVQRSKLKSKPYTPQSPRPPFLLTPSFLMGPSKKYDFAIQFALNSFPQKGYQAITALNKLLAPSCPEHTKLYLWTPAQVKALTEAVHKTIHCRWVFRRFYLRFLYRKLKIMNREANESDERCGTLDPITLEPISWPVCIIDIKQKAKYEFEQASLAKAWSKNLLQHDGLFVEPRLPTNPLTNLPLNILQIHQAMKIMKRRGNLDWVLSSFQVCSYDLEKWQTKFGTALQIESLERIFADKHSYDCQELLVEFADYQFDCNGLDFPIQMFRWIFRSPLVEEYAKLWVKECKKFYIKKYSMTDKDDLGDLEAETSVTCSYLLEIPTIVKVMYTKEVEKRDERRRVIQFPIIRRAPAERIFSEG